MNIAVIHHIECHTGNSILVVPFQSGSATYGCKVERGAAGNLYKYSLSFRLPGLEGESYRVISFLRQTQMVRLVDVNRLSMIIGNDELRVNVKIDESIGGTVGAWRGYDVAISWESSSPAPARVL